MEIRNLAPSGSADAQISALSDILEIVPQAVLSASDRELAVIRSELQRYKNAFPSSFEYLKFFDGEYAVPGPFASGGREP